MNFYNLIHTFLFIVKNSNLNHLITRHECKTITITTTTTELPTCNHCKYYVLRNNYDNYENTIISKTAHCSKFATKNLVSGAITDERVITCRNMNNMCGIAGRYFISIHEESTHGPENRFVHHEDKNACVDCKFGVAHTPTTPLEERDPVSENFQCSKFKLTDLVYGNKNIQLARVCRNNNELCGENGRYFIKK
jgi:hypothetical protein